MRYDPHTNTTYINITHGPIIIARPPRPKPISTPIYKPPRPKPFFDPHKVEPLIRQHNRIRNTTFQINQGFDTAADFHKSSFKMHQKFLERSRNLMLNGSVDAFHSNHIVANNSNFMNAFTKQIHNNIDNLNNAIATHEKEIKEINNLIKTGTRLRQKQIKKLQNRLGNHNNKLKKLNRRKDHYVNLSKKQNSIVKKILNKTKSPGFLKRYTIFRAKLLILKKRFRYPIIRKALLGKDADLAIHYLESGHHPLTDRDKLSLWLAKNISDLSLIKIGSKGGMKALTKMYFNLTSGVFVWKKERKAAFRIAKIFALTELYISESNRVIQKNQKEGGSYKKFEEDGPKLDYSAYRPFFDLQKNIAKSQIRKPLENVVQGKKYKDTKFHAIRKDGSTHYGIDLTASIGTPVISPGVGKVVRSFLSDDGTNGETIVVYHGDFERNGKTFSIVSYYFHLSERLVKKGDILLGGQIFAKSGNTSSNPKKPNLIPHLHYEVREFPADLVKKKKFFGKSVLIYAKDPLDYMWPTLTPPDPD